MEDVAVKAQKAHIIRTSQERFASEYATRFRSENYQSFATLPENNAYLELYRLYYGADSFFKDLYAQSGRDLPRYIGAVKTLKAKGEDPRVQLEKALGR